MALSLADQYYLKSLDNYNYNWEESLTDLSYALSHDPDHAGANNLMGRLQMEHFKNFELAEEYFVQAMVSNPFHIQTCMDYLKLMLKLKKGKEFEKLVQHALTIQGIDKAEVLQLKAHYLELNQHFAEAKYTLEKAELLTIDECMIECLKDDTERVSNKLIKVSRLNYTSQ
jgi:tetratricopeptide (TPR) repeat protein